MTHLAAAARSEAERLGKPFRPVPVPPGEIFRMFDDASHLRWRRWAGTTAMAGSCSAASPRGSAPPRTLPEK